MPSRHTKCTSPLHLAAPRRVHRRGLGGEVARPLGRPRKRQSWTWPGHEGQNLTINVYAKGGEKHDPASACAAVTLALNGKIVGESPVSRASKYTASFVVPYQPGKLEAHCLDASRA